MTDYKALYEAQVEENTKLKVEVEDWKEVAEKKNIHPYTGEIIQPKDIINLQKALYELTDKFEDIEQSSESTAYHELEIERLKKQIDDYWKVDDEIGGFVSGKFPDIASHLRECFEEKERIRKLYLERNKELQEEIDKWKKTCLRWQEKADFNLTDSDEESSDEDSD